MKSKKLAGFLLIVSCAVSYSALANVADNTSVQNIENKGLQTAPEQTATSVDQTVDKAVDKAALQSLLSKFTTMQADFKQVITDLQGQELQASSGQILLQKPQQLRWSVTEPEESLLLADGTTVYNIDPFVQQVTLMDQAQLTKSNPLMLLISDDKNQWQQVNVSAQKLSQNMSTNQRFDVVSLDTNSPITKLELLFNSEGKLVQLTSTDRQQQHNLLTFSNINYAAAASKDSFTYTVETDWVVDDQRSAEK